MKPSVHYCKQFEIDKQVVACLLDHDEKIRESVINCLYNLYAKDCRDWLLKTAGNEGGFTDVHDSHHAFNDALLALQACIKANRFNPDERPNSVRRYIHMVARNIYQRLKSGKAIDRITIPLGEHAELYPDPDFFFPLEEKKERSAQFRKAINELPEHYREPCRLRYLEDWKIIGIANKLGKERKAVITLLFRGRVLIQKMMTSHN